MLSAFAPGGLFRFGLNTLVHERSLATFVLGALLVPWTVAIVLAPEGLWFPSRAVQMAWATFDGMLIVLLGQREFYRLIEDKGAHPLVGFGLSAGAALTVVQYVGTDYQANLLMTATLLAGMVFQLGKNEITEAWSGSQVAHKRAAARQRIVLRTRMGFGLSAVCIETNRTGKRI